MKQHVYLRRGLGACNCMLFVLFCLAGSLLPLSPSYAQLSGTYTLGGVNADYPTFTEAAAALHLEGISGPVTFKVKPGLYEEQLVLSDFPGNSCSFPVVFEGEGPDGGLAELRASGPAVVIEGADGIHLRYMKMGELLIKEGSNCFLLENSTVEWRLRAQSGPGELANHHHIYRNNTLGHVSKIKIGLFYPAQPDFDEGLEITGNTIGSYEKGVELHAQKGIVINNNSISIDSERDGGFGISLTNCWYGKEIRGNSIAIESYYGRGAAIHTTSGIPERISENRISMMAAETIDNPYGQDEVGLGGGIGILVSTGKTESGQVLIANNDVYIDGYDRAGQLDEVLGIYLKETHAETDIIKVYHNTLNTIGYKDLDESTPLLVGAVADKSVHILNNILIDRAYGHAINIQKPSAVAVSDYNFFGGIFSSVSFAWGNQTVESLQAWQQLTGMDTHSITSGSVQGAGTYLPEVPRDINGDLRNNPPDIGALELEPLPEGPEPTNGLIAGGGVILSPEGAFVPDPLMKGKAVLALMAVKTEQDEKPGGHVMFRIPGARFHFRSTDAFQWMSVSENVAFLKGSGKLNKEEGFSFLIAAVDMEKADREKDRFRIMVWNSEGSLIYDNQRGSAMYEQAIALLERGNIVIREEAESMPAPASRTVAVKAYPTDLSSSLLWLEIPGEEGRREFKASVFNSRWHSMGVKSFSVEAEGAKLLWELGSADWPSGIYYLIIEGEGIRHQQRLVK